MRVYLKPDNTLAGHLPLISMIPTPQEKTVQYGMFKRGGGQKSGAPVCESSVVLGPHQNGNPKQNMTLTIDDTFGKFSMLGYPNGPRTQILGL